jgi:hypothetical protein
MGQSLIARVLVHLSAADMRRLPKPRNGFEPFAESLIALVKKQPDTLRIKGFDADAVLAELREYQALEAVVTSAKQQLAMAQETRLLHGSNVWRAILRIYRHAQLVALVDPGIAFAIAAFEAFMKVRKHGKTTTTPVVSPSPRPLP